MALDIVPLAPELYGVWDQRCLESPEAWFWHTSGFHEYHLKFKPEFKPAQHSFLVMENKEAAAGCMLFAEETAGPTGAITQLSFSGQPVWAPFVSPRVGPVRRREITAAIFEHIETVGRHVGAVSA